MDADPDLKLSGLSIWVVDREFPEASDGCDSEWLQVRAVMEATGARVTCEGSILTIGDFHRFRDELWALHEQLKGEATLQGYEPNLKVSIKAGDLGHMHVEVEVTPDHFEQSHWFALELDQSYLTSLTAECDAILDRFPVHRAS